jgi:formate-dependent nitrite reductase membrane component NrfD
VTARPGIGTTRLAQGAGRPGMTGEGSPSPYDRPIIKEPVWTWEIPLYFFTGGLAGGSAALAFGAGLAGNDALARRSWAVAMAGVTLSPALLISDLGKPMRFFNMLRVFKVTSPMSVGSWILACAGATTAGATLHAYTGLFGRAAAVCRPASAALGLPLTTYTAALVANTAVPAWHDARRELPFVFGSSSVGSAGAVAAMLTPSRHAAPARRMAVAGSLAEVAISQVMEHRLGSIGDAYTKGAAGRFGTAGKALGVCGAALMAAAGGRSRTAAIASGAMISAGAVALRWSVFKAGAQSAADPAQTVVPQRERIESRRTNGASPAR